MKGERVPRERGKNKPLVAEFEIKDKRKYYAAADFQREVERRKMIAPGGTGSWSGTVVP